VSCERDFAIKSGDEILADGRSIWAVISRETGKLVHMDQLYPTGIDFDKPVPEDIAFERLGKKFDDAKHLGSYTVRSVDIDLGGHMNNAAYVRALFSIFTTGELDKMNITDCEVCYKHSCYEGDTLTFYKRRKDNSTEIVGKNGKGETAILAVLK
jgi:acyl-ACP thioesterase